MIKYFKEFIKLLLDNNNVSYYRNIEKEKILNLIKLFKPFNVDYSLIRIGNDDDGGYLLPDCLEDIRYCFSAGVGDKTSFEKHLKKFGIHSFLADFSVENNQSMKDFDFEKKFIKSYNSETSWEINEWINKKVKTENKNNLLLQMDIEGSEYEVINSISEDNLSAFKILIIELHSLEYAGNHLLNQIINSSLKKLLKEFEIVHIHPNNWKKLTKINGFNLPSNLEVTFLNKKFVKKKVNIDTLPHQLDRKNVKQQPDIYLDQYWYK